MSRLGLGLALQCRREDVGTGLKFALQPLCCWCGGDGSFSSKTTTPLLLRTNSFADCVLNLAPSIQRRDEINSSLNAQ